MGGSKRLNFRQGGHVFGASQPLAVYWTRSAPERWKDDEHNLQDIAPVGKAFGSSINQDLGVETIEVIWREICESFNYRGVVFETVSLFISKVRTFVKKCFVLAHVVCDPRYQTRKRTCLPEPIERTYQHRIGRGQRLCNFL